MNALIYIYVYILYIFSVMSSQVVPRFSSHIPKKKEQIHQKRFVPDLLRLSRGPLSQALTAALQQTKLSWMVDSYIPWWFG